MSKIPLDLPAPDFSLPDLQGKTVQLKEFKNVSNVLLVFNRGFI